MNNLKRLSLAAVLLLAACSPKIEEEGPGQVSYAGDGPEATGWIFVEAVGPTTLRVLYQLQTSQYPAPPQILIPGGDRGVQIPGFAWWEQLPEGWLLSVRYNAGNFLVGPVPHYTAALETYAQTMGNAPYTIHHLE